MSKLINQRDWRHYQWSPLQGHLFEGSPDDLLLRYVVQFLALKGVRTVHSAWLGGLATARAGDTVIDEHGNPVTKCKSDILLKVLHDGGSQVVGVSVKSCHARIPTNDQLYFTTASAFTNLLRANGIPVTKDFEVGFKMFCGDPGFRPADSLESLASRRSDPDRWFYEELPEPSRAAIERIFTECQRKVSDILLRKAYSDDPFAPDFLIHQRCFSQDATRVPVALFAIDELIEYSCKHCGFELKPYYVRKGRFKGDPAEHMAPRFGFIQFQRGGQKQHPTQLQFNLKAGYFNLIEALG